MGANKHFVCVGFICTYMGANKLKVYSHLYRQLHCRRREGRGGVSGQSSLGGPDPEGLLGDSEALLHSKMYNRFAGDFNNIQIIAGRVREFPHCGTTGRALT